MGVFKSKAEKEQERRMAVRRSMKELEKRIVTLKKLEAEHIRSAQEAMREELPDQIKLAKEALKLTISERKRTYKMLLNARIISQMRDMSNMTSEFLNAISIISKDIANTTNADMSKLSGELRNAMDKMTQQTEDLGEMLEDSQDYMGDFSEGSSLVSDDEIDKLIYGRGGEGATDAELDDELAALKKQLEQQ